MLSQNFSEQHPQFAHFADTVLLLCLHGLFDGRIWGHIRCKHSGAGTFAEHGWIRLRQACAYPPARQLRGKDNFFAA